MVEHYGSGSVVLDVNSLWLGDGFTSYLNKQVSPCDALLVVIGDGWATRRLDAAADIVQAEVCLAAKLGIPVIPVLVDRASMPELGDLPLHLKTLVRFNAAEVRLGRDYQSHLELLVQGLDRVFEHAAATSLPKESPRTIELGGIVTNSIGMQLKLISAGEFLMGSPDADNTARENEKPQHLVRIAKPFYLGTYVVTQAQYEGVLGPRPWRRGRPLVQEGPDYPETYVSWDDAVNFCHKLSQQEGVEYQLPTEAQWEYACRAGTTTVYSFGDDPAKLGEYSWHRTNTWDVGEEYAHRVGEKLANHWGLHDMHGNVWEWCQEEYTAGRSGRALRGGSFSDDTEYCRSAIRHWHFPDRRI
ncbi:MAG TPA: formylglycine-generating enzyme family protein, partial [Pirellulaceae bacterium]|nr:formylglycine-generating enzyme family protein [Pirellulaceae bacterium]